jgi:toxin CcdB
MNQFDVCENLVREERWRAPYFVLLQSNYLHSTDLRVVAPLVKLELIIPVGRLNPIFAIEGRKLALSMLEILSTHRRWIGRKVADLNSERDQIIAAIDLLFTGF